MAAVSGAAPTAGGRPTSKKAVKPRKPARSVQHPKYREMIATAIRNLKKRRGSSRQAILKYIMAKYKVGSEVNKINSRVKTALRAGIKSGAFKQVRGTGASGSFRLGEKAIRMAKPRKTKKRKRTAKKPTLKKAKTSGKKKAAATTKKSVAKKPKPTATRKLKSKTPEKAAAEKPKTEPPVKEVAKPKKVAKKSPAKKATKPTTSKK